MARRGLFTPGHPYSATHGQIVIPAKTYREALRIANAEAKRFDTAVHVVHRTKNPTVVATCIAERKRGFRITTCTLYKPIKKRKR